MLQVSDIHVYYGDSHVLQGMSLSVDREEIVCILGRNGAGKTTTMRGIMGLNPPEGGRVVFDEEDISRLPVYEITRRGIAFVPEDRRIFPGLTVAENIEIAVLSPKSDRRPWDIARIFETFPLLTHLRDRKGGNLSGGEQQMLAIARALAGNPTLLLLDEPCEGLAPVIVEELGNVILGLKSEMPILLAEQNAHFALAISDRGYVIDKGVPRFEGSRSDLMENHDVQKRYLAV
jgi:branched-chain amino acid transport system ATP-binding protein